MIINRLQSPALEDSKLTDLNLSFRLFDFQGSQYDTDRRLYFHSFASAREASIPVFVLKNVSLASNQSELRKYMTVSEEARTSQSTVEVMTEDGILLYALLRRNAIVCWNSRMEFLPENQYIIYEVSGAPDASWYKNLRKKK